VNFLPLQSLHGLRKPYGSARPAEWLDLSAQRGTQPALLALILDQ
jgi:hypothetical protein